MTPQSLSEYIDSKKAKPVELRKTPAWIRRQQAGLRKPQDRTSLIYGAFVPNGEGGAA
jgi:hypothetical protein